MARNGLQPWGVHHVSRQGFQWTKADFEDWIALPNPSGYYNGILKRCFDHYGLGKKCLLVSESNRISKLMRPRYAATEFCTCDLFTELHGHATDLIWDITQPASANLKATSWTSIICNAVLEHVIDPTTAISNQIEILSEGGYFFAMTHTPSFFYHAVPRDYVRFTHDYFEDLPDWLARTRGVEIELQELWSCDGYVNVCYRKLSSGAATAYGSKAQCSTTRVSKL